MKEYLEQNGIKVVDSEIIQYGDKEFAIKKLDANGDVMPVLVDFAHGKPMFKIHTDHHLSQVGHDDSQATNFRGARSNIETISQVMSPRDIFPNDDINLISTVDSANFKANNIDIDSVMRYDAKITDKTTLGLLVNKMMLAYKNKPGFMEELVMSSTPSLVNIYNNILRIKDRENYPDRLEMQQNQNDYIAQRSSSPDVVFKNGIIRQWGGGKMFKAGSYDRYTSFKIYPDADFLVIGWQMGMVQASCNPFKDDRALKGINLDELKDEILEENKGWMEKQKVPLSVVKWIAESSRGFNEESVGFTSVDLKTFYTDLVRSIDDNDFTAPLDDIMDKSFENLSEKEKEVLDRFYVPFYDIVKSQSGGHKCINNIQGMSYLKRPTRPPKGYYRNTSGKSPRYIDATRYFMNAFVDKIEKLMIAEKRGQSEV